MLAKDEPVKTIEIDMESVDVLGTPVSVKEFSQFWRTQSQNRSVFDLEKVPVSVSEKRTEWIER